MNSAGKGCRSRTSVADHRVDADVRTCLFPDARRIGRRSRAGIGHRRQWGKVHHYPLRTIFGRTDAPRDDHCHRLADKARFVVGKYAVRRNEFVRGVARPQRYVGRPDDRPVRNRLEPIVDRVGAGEHRDDSGQRHGFGAIDRANAGMGVRRAHHHRIGLVFRIDVVAEAATTGDEPRVLLAADGLADSSGDRVLRH